MRGLVLNTAHACRLEALARIIGTTHEQRDAFQSGCSLQAQMQLLEPLSALCDQRSG